LFAAVRKQPLQSAGAGEQGGLEEPEEKPWPKQG
jgi:hypothetical protein